MRLLCAVAVFLVGSLCWPPVEAVAATPGASPIAIERDGDLFTYRLGGGMRAVVASPPREHTPAWAPGHRRLAFVVWDRRIATLGLATSARRAVTRVPTWFDRITALAWSPTGDRIAFATVREYRAGGTHRLCGQVWTITPTGSARTKILRDQAFVTGLGWSADGRAIFASTEWPNGVDLCRPQAPQGVLRFRTDGSDLATIRETTASQLDVSADGRRIAYRGWLRTCHACGEIWRMAPTGNGAHVLAMPPEGMVGLFAPSFSPAGTRIAVIATAVHPSLWIMRADGSRLHRALGRVDGLDW